MLKLFFIAVFSVLFSGIAQASPTTTTIIIMRHAEKPAAGLGQLSCTGLNRALKLPAVMKQKFPNPSMIFVPNPAIQLHDQTGNYYYVRPLITIAPTAISLGLPLNVQFGHADTDSLHHALMDKTYTNETIYVVWEHTHLNAIARSLLEATGDKNTNLAHWSGEDYDSIYVIKITRDGSKVNSTFELHHQHLSHHISSTCPS